MEEKNYCQPRRGMDSDLNSESGSQLHSYPHIDSWTTM